MKLCVPQNGVSVLLFIVVSILHSLLFFNSYGFLSFLSHNHFFDRRIPSIDL